MTANRRLLRLAARPAAGWALSLAGLLAVTVGYLGVSREAITAKQVPYLVSGGLGGLALVVLGAAVINGSDVRRQLRRVEVLERQVGDLHALLVEEVAGTAEDHAASQPGRRQPTDGARAAGATRGAADHHGARADHDVARAEHQLPVPSRRRPAGRLVPGQPGQPSPAGPLQQRLAVPDGTRYHRAGCPLVAGKAQAQQVGPAEVRARDLSPCQVCEPAPVLV